MAKRIAKFEKVTYERFKEDWENTFKYYYDDTIKARYKILQLPQRATKFSAGYDFYSPLGFKLKPGENIKIPTGIRCHMNNDYVLMLYVRSSIGFKYHTILANGTGIIDADYVNSDNEGHIFIKLVNNGNKSLEVSCGDAICQGIFLPYGITEDDSVEATRNGGFGSTDKKE